MTSRPFPTAVLQKKKKKKKKKTGQCTTPTAAPHGRRFCTLSGDTPHVTFLLVLLTSSAARFVCSPSRLRGVNFHGQVFHQILGARRPHATISQRNFRNNFDVFSPFHSRARLPTSQIQMRHLPTSSLFLFLTRPTWRTFSVRSER